MKQRIAFPLLPFIIALPLLAAFMITAPVFAQDELPPEAPVPTEKAPLVDQNPVSEPLPTEVIPTEEVPAIDPTPVDQAVEEAPVLEESVVEPPSENQPELAPALEAAADSGIVLVDETGSALELSTDEAMQTISSGDPYYTTAAGKFMFLRIGPCPVPLPVGTVYCTVNAAPIQAAIDYIPTSGLPSNGLIYVEADTYPDSPTVDAASYPILSGLKGLIGNVVDGTPAVHTGRIFVTGVTKGFTITGFDISSAASSASIAIYNSQGPIKIEDVVVVDSNVIGHGIEIINVNGLVTINRAKVNGNPGGGALIDNTLGVGTAGVTITNSSFDNNGSNVTDHVSGLTIASKGAVSIDGITASNLTGGESAVFIRQSGALTVKNSVFNNNDGLGLTNDWSVSTIVPTGAIIISNVYATDHNNSADGLRLYTKGNITLTGVHADKNDGRGAFLDTCGYSGGICTWSGTGVVTIKDSTFERNNTDNFTLFVIARGPISLSNVSASLNADISLSPSGAYLDNGYSQLTVPVTITSSNFNQNDQDGVRIYTKGTVTLSKVQANSNSEGYGVYIDNCLYDGGLAKCLGTGAVTITGTAAGDNQFNSNRLNNLEIDTKGAITIKYTYANQSLAGSGADLNNFHTGATAGVTISDSRFGDDSSGNAVSGLIVNTNGSVSLTRVDAIYNYSSDGARILLHGTSGTITVNGGYYSYNDLSGLNITGKGNITITGIITYHNSIGADINNTSGTGGVTISKSSFDGNVGTLTLDAGLIVDTNGSINLSDVSASLNNNDGARMDNSLGTAGITLKNVKFNNNHSGSGLAINSKGAVTATTIEASNNWDGLGASVYNAFSLPANVSIINGTFFNNDDTGLSIYSKGNITLSNTASWSNDFNAGAMGAFISNVAGTGFVKITNLPSVGSAYLKGFDQNSGHGIMISTNGTVTLTNVNAISNDLNGVEIPLHANKGVTLTNCRLNDNDGAGASIRSLGPIVVTSTDFTNNGIAAHFDNTYSGIASPKPITMSNSMAMDNANGGFEIDSYGAVSLTSITVMDNDDLFGIGINISNYQGTAGVTLNKVYSYYSGDAGIHIETNGALVYKVGEVKYNHGNGIELYSVPGVRPKAVVLSDLYIYNNDGYGAEVFNQGPITLTNVSSSSNTAGNGLFLDNTLCGTTTPCLVNILKTGNNINDFSGNIGGYGLRINTFGAVVVNNIAANINSQYGALITNNSADPLKPANVTITSGAFSENKNGNGLRIFSRGIISLNGIEASNNLNGYQGAYLDNINDMSGSKGINVTKSKFFGNTLEGLYLRTRGIVILNTVEASENDAAGVDINNDYGLGKPVTVLASYGANKFIQNFNDNIVIVSNGSVALTSVTGNQSIANDGIDIDNDSGIGTITLTNVTANLNSHNGFNLWTNGNVTIKGITAMFNTNTGNYAGLYINTKDTTTAKVTITTGLISSNTDHGILLNIAPNKLYTLSGVFYFGNDSDNDGIGYNLSVY